MTEDVNMTNGDIRKHILNFMFPLIFSGILQNIYSISDIVIAGRIIGIEAISGIGNTFAPLVFLNSFINGFASGILILESRTYIHILYNKFHGIKSENSYVNERIFSNSAGRNSFCNKL